MVIVNYISTSLSNNSNFGNKAAPSPETRQITVVVVGGDGGGGGGGGGGVLFCFVTYNFVLLHINQAEYMQAHF